MAMAACPEEVDQIMRASTSKDGSWDNTGEL